VTKISAVVPDEHARLLEARARADDRSVSSCIRRAIAEILTSPSLGGRGARDESARYHGGQLANCATERDGVSAYPFSEYEAGVEPAPWRFPAWKRRVRKASRFGSTMRVARAVPALDALVVWSRCGLEDVVERDTTSSSS
jgi:hypothetical protein